MKTIYVVDAINFSDRLYFETEDDAVSFAGDQLDMGLQSEVSYEEVTEAEFARRMETMEVPDGQGDPQ